MSSRRPVSSFDDLFGTQAFEAALHQMSSTFASRTIAVSNGQVVRMKDVFDRSQENGVSVLKQSVASGSTIILDQLQVRICCAFPVRIVLCLTFCLC